MRSSNEKIHFLSLGFTLYFPSPHMEDPWTIARAIQQVKDPTKPSSPTDPRPNGWTQSPWLVRFGSASHKNRIFSSGSRFKYYKLVLPDLIDSLRLKKKKKNQFFLGEHVKTNLISDKTKTELLRLHANAKPQSTRKVILNFKSKSLPQFHSQKPLWVLNLILPSHSLSLKKSESHSLKNHSPFSLLSNLNLKSL